MANVLGIYNPLFYANEGLIHLQKALGMASRVHRGYDAERKSFAKGETINIRRPSTFTAQNAPSTAQDVLTGSVQLKLDFWKEVKFTLTDKELAFTTEKIIEDHIEPAAYALADDIDQKLCALYADIPWHYDLNAAPGSVIADITEPYRVLFVNNVPMSDSGRVSFMVDGVMQSNLMANAAFSQWSGAGQTGVDVQRRGSLGDRFGFGFHANQNVRSHVKGTASTGTLAVNVAALKGATTMGIDAASVTGTLVPGDTFVIAGNAQRYAITNTVTAATNAFAGVQFTPALVVDAADNAVVTASLDDHTANLAYHRNAFAIAMAPLPEHGAELGSRVATVTDPRTQLSLRSRVFYMPDTSEVKVALDVLYGVKTLDPNLAVRARG